MIKKILAAIVAIALSLLAIRVVFWIIGMMFNMIVWGIFAGVALLLAIPIYLYVRRTLLK